MLTDYLVEVAGVWESFVLGATLCVLVELLFPSEKQGWASRTRGAIFTCVSLAVAVLAQMLVQRGMAATGLKPLFSIDLAATIHSDNSLVVVAGYTLAPLVAVLVYDVAYYCFHRLQHAVPFLWRFHAVHHSIEELNVFNSYHHVSEYFLRIPLLILPLNLLVHVAEPQVAIAGAMLGIAGKLAHANTTLSFGPFRYLLVEPSYHRLHHSLDERHWNRNFAFYFSFLDTLLGTAHHPGFDEYPKTGLDYVREPRGMKSYLCPPKPPRAETPLAVSAAPLR